MLAGYLLMKVFHQSLTLLTLLISFCCFYFHLGDQVSGKCCLVFFFMWQRVSFFARCQPTLANKLEVREKLFLIVCSVVSWDKERGFFGLLDSSSFTVITSSVTLFLVWLILILYSTRGFLLCIYSTETSSQTEIFIHPFVLWSNSPEESLAKCFWIIQAHREAN